MNIASYLGTVIATAIGSVVIISKKSHIFTYVVIFQ